MVNVKWLARMAVLWVFASGSATALANDGPWDPYTLATSTIFLDASLKFCEPLTSAPTYEDHRAAVSTAMPLILDGLTARALHVHPKRPAADLRAEIEAWFEFNLTTIQTTLPQDRICNLLPDAARRALAEHFVSNTFPAKMRATANAPFTYGQTIPLANAPHLASYALPDFQEMFVTRIGKRAGCPDPVIDSIHLLQRVENTADNLPAFLGPPLTYVELWVALCGEEVHKFAVVFTRDSESMKAQHSIMPVEE